MTNLNAMKNMAQPTKIKTGGSTFKNPLNQTDKKVWKLIEESVSPEIHFGDASISKKHKNFFVNISESIGKNWWIVFFNLNLDRTFEELRVEDVTKINLEPLSSGININFLLITEVSIKKRFTK